MIRNIVLMMIAMCLSIGSTSMSAAAELSEDEQQAGFQPMFNGTDFSGWRFVGKGEPAAEAPNWKAVDGVIQLSGGGAPHLSTDREYADFEMRFEWKAGRDRYNSGFYIRSGPKLGGNQINLAKGAEGKLMYGKAQGGDAVPQLQKPAGQWNAWRVVVEKDRATFYCNGQEAWKATGLVPERGFIGLQAEGAPMEFRNLRIREIK